MMTSSLLLLACLKLACSQAPPTNHTQTNHSKCGGSSGCKDGVMLSVWRPEDPAFSERVARASIYFLGLVYMFLGVSIIADRFMASIQVITSQERQVSIKNANGQKETATVRVWNETVSNLTLMALGSSAPEILLSVVEVCGHNFDAGELGPNTIVGSAAFNMFVIIGLCVYVIPDGQTRRVKHLRVFFVTAAWSVFAYTWLYLILAVFSPGVVQIWEGLLTLFFFPVCVGLAYVADRRLLFYKYVYKRYRAGKHRGVIIETEGQPEFGSKADVEMNVGSFLPGGQELPHFPEEMRRGREELQRDQELLQGEERQCGEELLQGGEPQQGKEELASGEGGLRWEEAELKAKQMTPLATTGRADVPKKMAAHQTRTNRSSCEVFFQSSSYQCVENCGSVALNVVRRGGGLSATVAVDYHTQDGNAIAGSDYRSARGTLVFAAGETVKEILIDIMDDDIFEEEEHFLVHLSHVRLVSQQEEEEEEEEEESQVTLGVSSTATVAILDDDHAGIFSLEEEVLTVSESVGVMEVKVLRSSGSRGLVVLPYRTLEGSARGGGRHFQDSHGVLQFHNNQICQKVSIQVVAEEREKYEEKKKNFFLELGEPRLLEMSQRKAVLLQEEEKEGGQGVATKEDQERRIAQMGLPQLGQYTKVEIIIEESYEFKSAVDKVMKKTRLAVLIGTTSWRQQFVDAMTVTAGDDDDDKEEEKKVPSSLDHVLHFLTVFWKLLFALVPPTDYCRGWPCFLVSIIIIGVLTAIIGDLASHFGCTVGLKDSVTAVVFVALGTSVPDTFASKTSACQDQYADASIGNVTGSNAVNVFLGIGVAWSIAAVYHYSKNQEFKVDPGTLAFSVTLFTIFAFICIAVLLYRRRPGIGGELGGPRVPKMLTTALFFSLWLMYIILSSLEAYCHIQGF
ncbi:sodium/calcium exchanger 1-like isoform X2 [Nerophis ophidion]|uniref:sodium/calcium exchanger 1-like isoform X2 n=1 Tax=Nerophis ophidion TaxID=159077 RepID=UPI002AE077A1|nr:sodium/calcium exchanger 1-like isoform X2 [Nerophis ophidion]